MISHKNKKITVVGLARSGESVARLLSDNGASVSITEKNNSRELKDKAAELRSKGIESELGGHTSSFIEGRDMVVISPGVRLDSDPVLWAKTYGIDVVSEIEIAYELCPAPVIAITGTNGKTTTTTLVGEIIKASGKRAHVVGNIGVSFSSAVPAIKKDDVVVLEVSSFQLEAIKNFRPRVAVILNITPDHMDRYGSLQEYIDAKKRIFANQGRGDFLVLNYGDEFLRNIAPESGPSIIFFNRDNKDCGLNQNQMAAMAVAEVLGIKRDVCIGVFDNFKGVEHRMEFVRVINGIEFVNDSKATNIDSTVWALKNIKKPAVLIAGGRDKGSDFTSIRELVREKIREVVLVGEAADKIASAWQGLLPLQKSETFSEAVESAYHKAKSGEIVLLSPMCKSFDMFSDYEHRGRTFKDIVSRLK